MMTDLIGDGMIKAERGCGSRKKGGSYLVCETSRGGMPIEYFLLCQPMLDVPVHLGAVGSMIDQVDGVYHVFDHIGQEHYPYVPDFVEEGIALRGFSRAINPRLDLSVLEPGLSRQIFAHPRAWINGDMLSYSYALMDQEYVVRGSCPKGHLDHTVTHDREIQMCTGFLWHSVIPSKGDTKLTDVDGNEIDDRKFWRSRPSFNYIPASPPITDILWDRALFMWLPIHRIDVIKDPDDGTHEETLDLLDKSGNNLPVRLEDE